MTQDTNRATGKTTGLMLQAIGKAIENPGMEVEFIDHHCPQSPAQLQLCKKKIENIAQQLNLDIAVVVVHYPFRENEKDKIYVKSNWISPYSQTREAEEKWREIYGYCPDKQQLVWHYFQQGFEAAHVD